jgi:hypothetical protein
MYISCAVNDTSTAEGKQFAAIWRAIRVDFHCNKEVRDKQSTTSPPRFMRWAGGVTHICKEKPSVCRYGCAYS